MKVTGGSGRFILGLVDTGNSTYMSELTNDSGNGHSGLTWGNAFYDYGSYTAPGRHTEETLLTLAFLMVRGGRTLAMTR